MSRIVVAGGAGFLGSHLCDYFVGRGDSVVCVDDLIPAFETLYGTMSDAQKKQADTVFDQPHHRASAKKKSS